MKKKNCISILILFIISQNLFSQNNNELDLSNKEKRANRAAYIDISAGISFVSFCDFATSPITYEGGAFYINLSYLRKDEKRETRGSLSYLSGISVNNDDDYFTASTVKSLSVYYSSLFAIQKLCSSQYNTKVGGMIKTTGILRMNESLLNNSLGVDIIPTLYGCVKLTKDISRKTEQHKKILFYKYSLKPRQRQLSYQVNIGLINASYRNGYAYINQDAILNSSSVFGDYHFNIFSGFSMGSELDYTISLKNKNQIQFSYLWDAYKTGGEYEPLQMATHTLKFSLLFNTNNK